MKQQPARSFGVCISLAAAMLAVVQAAPAYPRATMGPLDPIAETIAENQNQGPNNVLVSGNVVCQITPHDPASDQPTFYGVGSGTPQTAADDVLVKAGDDVAFAAVCASPDSQAFVATADYRFQYRAPAGWTDIPAAESCSASSATAGDANTAVVAAPGATGCSFERLYPENHFSLDSWHRLEIHLTVALAGGGAGPDIKGWTLPWFVERT